MSTKSMHERLKELTFYGCGDEVVELFSLTCHLCYEMYGLNELEHAEILFNWAKEQADNSKEFAFGEGSKYVDPKDTCTGICF